MTASETERPMRERAANAAARCLAAEFDTCANPTNDPQGECADGDCWCVRFAVTIADAVLAEIERPSEGMIQAATDAYEEWCLDEDTFSVAKLAELMLAAAIRAAREGR